MATTASLSSSNAPENMQRHLRLLAASVSGNEARVRAVLAEEKWPTAADLDTLRQALVKAATKGNSKILRLLLDSGAEVHPRKDNEVSPLFKAAEAGHNEVVSVLLERRADPNWQFKNGQTALFRAAEGGQLKVVAKLLQSGADPNVRAKNGQVALHLACLRGHNPIVQALLEAGADADGGRGKDKGPGDRDGRTPLLFIASEKSSKWNVGTVKLLLEKGANPDAMDSTERTPLHWAATNGYLELGRILLAGNYGTKPNINATQNRGKTALHFASVHNREDFVDLLISNKAFLDSKSDGQWTPLINAADKGHTGVVSKLLAAGANVNAQTSTHMTALHWAASNGHDDVVKILLYRPETNLAIKDNDERTPMICAAEGRHNRIVAMLSPARHADRLSESAREATEKFEATIVDFGEFQEMKWQKRDVSQKKPQLVFHPTVFDLLYGWDKKEDKPTVPVFTKNIKWKPQFRWIHLPANNIAWIETLLAKSFIEGGHRDVEGFKALGKCFDQEHRGPLAHANFMRAYCHRVPSSRSDRDDNSGLDSVVEQTNTDHIAGPSQAGIDSQPTDLSENSIGRGDASKKKSKSEQLAERHPQRPKRKKGNPGNPPGTKEARLSSRQPSFASSEVFRQLVNNGKMVLFMPFLHYETHRRRMSMTTTIESARRGHRPRKDASRDELLVHAYWKNHLHMRRTLDQYFYHGIDTTQRDSDQVVWRYCDKYRQPEEPKLFMVDQLWMWILGGDTVITCFPQRWDQPKQDPLNVVDGIIAETSAKTRRETPIQSVYDLAMVITNRCAGMFDRHRVEEEQFQFLDMFESSIGSVTDQEGKLFSKFKTASEESTKWLHRHRHRRETKAQTEHEFSDDLLNIHQETRLLVEIKDIQDELTILTNVLHSQALVLEKFQKTIEEELRAEGATRKATDLVLKDIRRHFQEQLHLINVHHDDIDRMYEQAKEIYLSLTNLLDLKQKHSNALEARFAREQALIAAKQGQTIMVFTIVTIIFLPMSFIASFFAINFEDWGDRLTMAYASRYMFPIGLAISFIFVAAAFLVEDISDAWKSSVRGVRHKLVGLFKARASKTTSNDVGGNLLGEKDSDTTRVNAGTVGTWKSMVDDVDSKPRGRERTINISYDRDSYRGANLGFSPLRHGARELARELSPRSGRGGVPWPRPSLDGWRNRFSGDLERGRDPGRLP